MPRGRLAQRRMRILQEVSIEFGQPEPFGQLVRVITGFQPLKLHSSENKQKLCFRRFCFLQPARRLTVDMN